MSLAEQSTSIEETAEVYQRTTHLLLEAISLHAVEGEPQDFGAFQTTLGALNKALENGPSPSQVLGTANAAANALQDYSRRTSEFIKAQNAQLQDIIGELVETMAAIMPARGGVKRLQEVAASLVKVKSLDERRAIRVRFTESLQALRAEPAQSPNAGPVAPTQAAAAPAEAAKPDTPVAPPVQPGEEDPLTGLPMRKQAEAAIRDWYGRGKHFYVAVFTVDRVESINSRYGQAIGDQVLLVFLQRLAQDLDPNDQIFRWGDSCFIALLARTDEQKLVHRQIFRILARRLEQNFNVGNRSVLLPVTASWKLIPTEAATPKSITANIDAFLAAGDV